MGLPKQVRRQIEEAQRIEAELRASQETPPTPPAPAEPVEATPSPADTPSPTSEPTPPPAPPPAPVEPAAPAEPDIRGQYEQLLQQHRTLQGIHRSLIASRGELETRVNQQAEQLQQLTARLQQMSQPPQTPVAVAPALTKEEVEEYGPELISIIERKAHEVAGPIQAQLGDALRAVQALSERNAQLERVVGSTAQNQTQIAQAAFFESLGQYVPQWEQLNYDERFLSWLDQPNPFSAGKARRVAFDEAVNGFDVETTANFFLEFVKSLPPAPATAPQTQGTPVTVPQIAEHVAPASRPGPDTVTPQQGRIWTQAEIANFYAEVARGKYTPQEKQRIEREIYKAQRDNRIAA